jgi:hypothetical protein
MAPKASLALLLVLAAPSHALRWTAQAADASTHCKRTTVAPRAALAPSNRPTTNRRTALALAAAAAATAAIAPSSQAYAAQDPVKTLTETAELLHAFLDKKAAFVDAAASGATLPPLPPQVPFTTFQALEKKAEPEFMDIAIDYAEAARAARDLYKLAKLTTQPVEVSYKEPGKPRTTEIKTLGETNASLSSAKEYAERTAQEVLGASLALDAAIKVLKKE